MASREEIVQAFKDAGAGTGRSFTQAEIQSIAANAGKQASSDVAANQRGKRGSTAGATSKPKSTGDFIQIAKDAVAASAVESAGKIVNVSGTEELTAERSSLLQQLNSLQANAGYITTTEQSDQHQAQQKQITDRLREIDKQLGSPEQYYTPGEKLGGFFGGNAKTYGAGMANAAGTLVDANAKSGGWLDYALNVAASQGGYAQVNPTGPNYSEERIAGEQAVADRLQAKADELLKQGTSDIEAVKFGMGKVGQTLVDAAGSAVQMGGDVALGTLTGGSSLIPMAVRTFGSASQEARQQGASLEQQLGYGAVSAATELVTEKIFDGLAGFYGVGAADEAVEKLIGKLTSNATGQNVLRVLAGAAGEASEEIMSSAVNPILRTIYSGNTAGQEYSTEEISDWLYSALIGAIMGGGTTAVGNAVKPKTGADMLLDYVNEQKAANKEAQTRGIDQAVEDVLAQQRQAAAKKNMAATQAKSQANAVVANILESGMVKSSYADTILADTNMMAAFEDIAGVKLDSTPERNRQRIMQALRDRIKTNAENERLAREAADEARTEQTRETLDALTQALESEPNYFVGRVLKIGATVADARKIVNDPQLRQLWESMSERKLPDSKNRAVEAIMHIRKRDATTTLDAETLLGLYGIPLAAQQPAQRETGIDMLVNYGKPAQSAQNAPTSAGGISTAPTAQNPSSGQAGALNSQGQGREAIAVVDRLKNSVPKLSKMQAVFDVNSEQIMSAPGQTLIEKARSIFNSIKGVVSRPGFGEVDINSRSMKDDFSHGIGFAKAAVIPSIPSVIKNGKKIDFQEQWKGRNYDGYIFAAPITLDGRTVYVAAVVKQTSKNRFYLHEVADSDGNIIKMYGGDKADPTSLTPVDVTGASSPPISAEPASPGSEAVASDNSIRNPAANVNSNSQPGQRERGFSENVRTDRNMEQEIRDMFENDPEMYTQLGNQETLQKAVDIFKTGMENATSTLYTALGEAKAGKKLSPEMIPLARMVANELAKQGNAAEARRITSDIAAELTFAGQLSQAARVLRNTDPLTQADVVTKLVNRINKNLTKGQMRANQKAGRSGDGLVHISDELLNEFVSAPEGQARDNALTVIQQSIADQMPATFHEKWTAFRYVNMLGNLKTQGRNIIGNSFMLVGTTAKNRIKAVTELGAALFSSGKYERTSSFVVAPKLYSAAWKDSDAVMERLKGDGKYNDNGAFLVKDIQDKRTIFKDPVREKYRKLTNQAMDIGDEVFLRANYADSLGGWLQAHGIKDIANASPEMLERGRSFAINEAQQATFRDSNKVSDWVSSLLRTPGTPKAVKIISEGVSPFRKTPANVAVRAVEYSPIGVVETIIKGVEAAQGKADPSDVINSLSKNVTGSALLVAGMIMQAAGRARATGADDDEKLNDFEKLRGEQDYSILINGKYVSLAQFAPLSIPFFMGVALQEELAAGINSTEDISRIFDALSGVLIESSMLSGLNDALADLSATNGDGSAITQLFANSAVKYLAQGLTNSLLGQGEQAFEENRQTIYTNPDSVLGSNLQYQLGQYGAKTPFVDYHQQDYVDAWGRTQSNGSKAERVFNAFLNPTYTSEDRSAEVDAELERLYRENRNVEGFPDVLPQKASRSLEYTKGTRMTPDEYMEYSKQRGQKSLELVSDFMRSSEYALLSDQQRAETISQLYEFAADRALKTVKTNNGVKYTGGLDDEAKLHDIPAYYAYNTVLSDAANGEADYSAVDKLIEEFTSLPKDVQTALNDNDALNTENLRYAAGQNVYSEEYYNVKNGIREAESAIGSTADLASAIYIGTVYSILSDEDKIALLKTMNQPSDTETGKKAAVVRGYEAAVRSGIPFDKWTQLLQRTYTIAGEASGKTDTQPKKAEVIAAARDLRISGTLAWGIYNKYNGLEEAEYYDEEWKLLHPYEPKPPADWYAFG